MRIAKSDVFRISGAQRDVKRVVRFIDCPIRPSDASDATLLAMGIFLGAIVGLFSIRVDKS